MENRDILKKIELKGFNKSLWNKAGKAMHKYGMIEDGDKIVVGISGGKDSLVLFNLLLRVKCIANIDFEIIPIHVHYKDYVGELDIVKDYLAQFGYEMITENTNIEKIVFDDKKESNPCALCSRMRRGVLYRMMKEKGYNKLALGHHLDDIIETFLMNFFYQGSVSKMQPAYTSEEYGIKVIRPMAFVEESVVIKYTRKAELPVVESTCRFNDSKNSSRKKMKDLITGLAQDKKDIRQVVLSSIMQV